MGVRAKTRRDVSSDGEGEIVPLSLAQPPLGPLLCKEGRIGSGRIGPAKKNSGQASLTGLRKRTCETH